MSKEKDMFDNDDSDISDSNEELEVPLRKQIIKEIIEEPEAEDNESITYNEEIETNNKFNALKLKSQANMSSVDSKNHYMTSRLSNAKIDTVIKSTAKSSIVLKTKSMLLPDNIIKREEEYRIELPEDSEMILDEEQKCYRRKNEQELSQMKATRFNTAKIIGSNETFPNKLKNFGESQNTQSTDSKRIKFSCVKIIYEFSDNEDDVPDYRDLPDKSTPKKKGKTKKASKKKKSKKSEEDEDEEDLSFLSDKEIERLKEARRKRQESEEQGKLEKEEKQSSTSISLSDNSSKKSTPKGKKKKK